MASMLGRLRSCRTQGRIERFVNGRGPRRLHLLACCVLLSTIPAVSARAGDEMQIEINKIGLGKEVVITEGPMEWFMRIEVTPENTVVVRQEKRGDRYLVDESETHDRSMSASEIDAAITDFINHVKVTHRKP